MGSTAGPERPSQPRSSLQPDAADLAPKPYSLALPKRASTPSDHSESSSTESCTDRYSSQFKKLLGRNVKRFRGGLVCEAHRLLYHSTLGLRVIKKRREGVRCGQRRGTRRARPSRPRFVCVGVCVCVCERERERERAPRDQRARLGPGRALPPHRQEDNIRANGTSQM